MKLRNKKTGEIVEVLTDSISVDILKDREEMTGFYNSLAKLNEEWEDYEEPKKHYEILAMGAVMEREDAEDEIFRNQGQREIGNYFETREEAEKAVEKLKAWKRLKDARFEFGTIKYNLDEESSSTIAYDGIITIEGMAYEDFAEDLDLLFGGEDEYQG